VTVTFEAAALLRLEPGRPRRRHEPRGQPGRLVLAPAVVLLVVLVGGSQVLMLAASLGRRSAYGGVIPGWSLENYLRALEPLYIRVLARSVILAAATTIVCLVVGYPVAYWLARRAPPTMRRALLVLVILPFWTSFLVRMYAWMFLLRTEGLVNLALGSLGLPALALLYNPAAVLLGQVYGELPVHHPSPVRLAGEARSRASRRRRRPGRAAARSAAARRVAPDVARHRGRLDPRLHSLAGRVSRAGPPGRRALRLRRQPDPEPVRGRARHPVRRGPLVRVVGGGALVLWIFRRPLQAGSGESGVTARATRAPSAGALVTLAVYAFLYAPLIVLVLFSFNQARLGARWEGFTLEWYAVALRDQRVLAALRNSVVIALATTVLATGAGTAAALAFHRLRVRTQGAWDALVVVPLVLPEIVLAASLVLLFAAMGMRLGLRDRWCSRTSPSASPTRSWSCARAWPASTAAWKKAAMDLGREPVAHAAPRDPAPHRARHPGRRPCSSSPSRSTTTW
jgi:ABC-type spermidine/putrescine transport system permease subunit I